MIYHEMELCYLATAAEPTGSPPVKLVEPLRMAPALEMREKAFSEIHFQRKVQDLVGTAVLVGI